MFSGTTPLNLDSKGRMAIPAKHRDALLAQCEGRLVMTIDPSGCVLIYPEPAWMPMAERLNRLSSLNPQVRGLQRLLIGNAEHVDMDAAGRVLVPSSLRARAGLDKEVALVGQAHKFELWDKATWDGVLDAMEPLTLDNLPAELEGFTL